jgi:hypothetical protein
LVIAYHLQVGLGGPLYIASSYSDDYGLNWSTPDTASLIAPGEPCECCPIAITAKGDTVAIAYRNNVSNIRDFYCLISHNAGISYTATGPIDTTQWFVSTCPMSGIDVAIINDSVVGTFMTRPGSFNQVKTGKTALVDSQLGNALFVNPVSFAQNHPALWAHNDTLAVVWQDNSSGNVDAYLTWSTGTQPYAPPVQITTATGTQQTPYVIYHKGIFHLVWHDLQAGRVKYRKASFTPFTGVINPQEEEKLFLYPNPITYWAEVLAPDDICGIVTNATGITVFSFHSKKMLQENITSLLPGFYLVNTHRFEPLRFIKL